MAQIAGRRRQWSREPDYYDPEAETDALVRQHIELGPPDLASGPAIVGSSGHSYPAWSVFLIFLIADGDLSLAIKNYGGDVSEEQVKAAVRFAELYPDLVLPYVEPHFPDASRADLLSVHAR